ncbi:Rad52/22 family double-strand break repair protein [Singulisphaera sp. GP187]|uniref:Rad52/Rad22 family DNA repair protein n=1 Tax=Singulisphaera sp. GP187 TaxID=1882752 RepID=UPI000925D3B4|nr:Rad52/Rad22 family DNA repair protein [Singulisphaera sp. GP187]SIO14244.1 Rad52/22 family double-strand break repair protein [Singulisphaera sp. GP187]
MTQHPDLFAALAAPFDSHELKLRSQSGRQLHYITARTVMNRLDTVLGPENWWDRYVPGENSVMCELTIRLPDGSTLTKSDAGGYAGMADSGDDDKSGYSDGFKRAAVKFGVARYLYRDGVPAFVQERTPGIEQAVPAPEPQPQPAPSPARSATATATAHGGNGGPPRTGKALFAWTKDQEQRYSVGLLKYLNSWAKLQEFPGRMVDWDAEQVTLAHGEACRKLQSIHATSSEAYEEALAN